MANRFLNNITINDEYTLPSADGTADQIITTDGAGQLSFVDQSTISSGSSEKVVIYAKNTHTASIAKGTPVYITGTVGATDTVQIAPADASNSAKMPAVGLLDETLAVNDFGYVITGGFMDNITTDPIDGGTPSSNDTVYVKPGGGLTLTKPTGSSNLIQNIAKVGKVSGGNSGSLIVSSILRTNDVPNLSTGKIWVGDSNTTESTVVHLDEPNGRMGIGTSTPGYKLDVNGSIRSGGNYLGSSSAYTYLSLANGNTHHKFYTKTNTTAASERFTIEGGAATTNAYFSNVNVGIGTTSPSRKLQVIGTDGSAKFYYNSSFTNAQYSVVDVGMMTSGTAADGFGPKITFRMGGNGYDGYASGNIGTVRNGADGTHNMTFGTSTSGSMSTKMTITNAGNVGIGTTSPALKLEVEGGDGLLQLSTTSSTGSPYMSFNQAGTRRSFIQHVDSGDNLKLASEYGGMQFFTGTGGTETVKMVIQSGGNVGVGTTIPSQKLHVNGTALFSSTIYVGDTSSSIYRYFNSLIIQNTASTTVNIGGGPGGVTNNLDVNGTIRGRNYFYLEDAAGTLRTTLRSEATYATLDNGTNTLNYNASNHLFLVGLSEKMRINSSGDVGIGTTSPAYLFDVAGDGRVNGKLRCVTLIQTSQRDQKKDIADINKTKAKAIPFKEYKYKSSIDGSERKRYGVVAEDIENDYPELVHTGADGIKGINYIDLLIKRVAELEKELEDISLTPGPKGDKGDTGAQGPAGANGENGNSHLGEVNSIGFNKNNQLEVTIGKTTLRFNPAK